MIFASFHNRAAVKLVLAVAAAFLAAPHLYALSQTRNAAAAAGTNWITPGNILDGSNNSYATYGSTAQNYLSVTDFGLSIPSNFVITGVSVTREGNAANNAGSKRQYKMGLTKTGSSPCGAVKTGLDLPKDTDNVANVGASSDLWGCSLSASEVNSSNFGLLIADNDTSSEELRFDSVALTVYYTPPPPAGVKADSVFISSVTITWTPIGSEAGYLVEASTAGNFTGALHSSATASGSAAALTVFSPALAANTTYFIRAGSLWNDGATSYAQAALSTATLAAVPGPGSPVFSDVGLSSVAFRWTGGGNPSDTYYAAEVSTDDFLTVNVSTGTRDLSMLFGTGGAGNPLSPFTVHYFRVKALNWNNLFSDYSAARSTVTLAEPPVILSAATVDDDLDGRIDAYHIIFSTPVNDSTLDAAGFQVQGRTGLVFYSSGTQNHPDTEDDPDIYIRFNEGSFPDTGQKPELTYDRSAGGLKSLFGGSFLQDISAGGLAETDGAAPVIVSARASDASGGGPGIQVGDTVGLEFSESVSGPPGVTSGDIDAILKTTATWKDMSGSLGGAQWSAMNSLLTITFSIAGGAPTLRETYLISSDSFTFADAAGNASSHTIVLAGGFGSDNTPPVIRSRETADLDGDGYLDAIRVIFTKNIDDNSVAAGDFSVEGVAGGVSFSPAAGGDAANDDSIYLVFTGGALMTDATPNLMYTRGSLADVHGNIMYSTPYTPCADKAAPVVFSAVAGDGTLLAPGLDDDDTVTITFSEGTNRPTIDPANIDRLFLLDNSHIWGDAYGTWNSRGDILTIGFGSGASGATVAVGDVVTVSSSIVIITDGILGNTRISTRTITGSFVGVDTASPTVESVLPQNGAAGVAGTSLIRIKFSERMAESNTRNAIRLVALKNGSGTDMDYTVPGGVSYDAGVSQFVFTPSSPLGHNFQYKVAVSTSASDTIGNHLQNDFESRFATLADANEANTVTAADDRTRVELGAGALDTGFSIAASTAPLDNPIRVNRDKILNANSVLLRGSDPFTALISGSFREFVAFDPAGVPINANFRSPVKLTLPYPDADNDGMIDGILPPVRESSLNIYYLREKQDIWVRVPSEVDALNNTVSGFIPHFSVFALSGASSLDLTKTYAFPVPFMPNSGLGHTGITFTGLSSRATIRIYTVSGRLVKTLEETDGDYILDWYPVKNDDGVDVASGVYIYRVSNAGEAKTGKLIIIR